MITNPVGSWLKRRQRRRDERRQIARSKQAIDRTNSAIDAEIAKAHAAGNENEEHRLRADRPHQNAFEYNTIQGIEDCWLVSDAERLNIYVPITDYADFTIVWPLLKDGARRRLLLAVAEQKRQRKLFWLTVVLAAISLLCAAVSVGQTWMQMRRSKAEHRSQRPIFRVVSLGKRRVNASYLPASSAGECLVFLYHPPVISHSLA
jgi:hypothetical protein